MSYLKRYAANPNVDVVSCTADDWKRFRNSSVHHRAAWNYWRGLVLGSPRPEAKGLMLFEDDVILAASWKHRLCRSIFNIEQFAFGRFALALYTPHELPRGETCYFVYPTRTFFGTQAMYYPDAIRRGFSEHLRVNGVEAHRQPYDLLLREYLKTNGIPLFVTNPCLAQHVGEISTGLGDYHCASAFQVDF